MRRPGLFGLLVFIAACVGDGPTAPFSSDATGALSGCLLQPDGTPLKDATVWVSGRYTEFSATTGDDGRFRFERLPGGALTLLAIGAGPSGDRGEADALAWKRDVTVVAGTERAFACETAPLASCIQGTVRAGAGVDAPPVEIVAAQSPLWTWSRASGSFTLRAPAGARFDLTAGAMNLQDATLEQVLVPESCKPGPSVFSMFSSGDDEERVWVELPEMNVSVADPTVALDGTHLYAAGGFSCPDGGFCSKSCQAGGVNCIEHKWAAAESSALQIFSFASGRWTTSDQPLPTARSAAAGAIFDGKFYVTGGWRSVAVLDVYPGTASAGPKTVEACIRGQYQPDGVPCRNGCFPCYLTTVERYNIEEKRWETFGTHRVAQLTRRRGFHAAVATSRALYLVGGVSYRMLDERSGYLSSISVYQNDDSQWVDFGADLITGAYEVNACLDSLHNRIYTLGGYNFDVEFPDNACYRLTHRYAFDVGGWGADGRAAPLAYGHTGCAVLGDVLYVPGHLTGEPTMQYDIAKDRWTVQEGPPNDSVRTALAFPYGFLAVSGGDASNAITSRKFYASVGRKYVGRLRALLPTLSEPPVADLRDTAIPPEPTADTVAKCVLPP